MNLEIYDVTITVQNNMSSGISWTIMKKYALYAKEISLVRSSENNKVCYFVHMWCIYCYAGNFVLVFENIIYVVLFVN